MAKGWKNFGNINGLVKSEESHSERTRRMNKFDTAIKTVTTYEDDFKYKKHLDETYQNAVAAEDHLLDVVANNRTTNKNLIKKAEKIKASREKASKRKEKKNEVSNGANN